MDAFEKKFEGVTTFTKKDLDDMPEMEIKEGVSFVGKCIVRAKADEFFGGENSKPYQSKVMDSPTWDDLFQCAVEQQKLTNDLHHNFFEDAYIAGKEFINGEEVTVLKLFLGS